MGVCKLRGRADKIEFPIQKLLLSIIGKLLNQSVFARHDLVEIEGDIFGANSPRLGMTGEVHDFSRVKQRLGGHATAENTEAADFLAALEDRSLEALTRGCTRRGVTGAAAAEDGQVVIEIGWCRAHI